MFNGGCNMAEDFGGIIVLAVIATIIALVLGAIALLLNFNWLSFLVGVALVGIGIGVTLVTALVIMFLNRIVTLNIPVIGDYVADIIDVLKTKGY